MKLVLRIPSKPIKSDKKEMPKINIPSGYDIKTTEQLNKIQENLLSNLITKTDENAKKISDNQLLMTGIIIVFFIALIGLIVTVFGFAIDAWRFHTESYWDYTNALNSFNSNTLQCKNISGFGTELPERVTPTECSNACVLGCNERKTEISRALYFRDYCLCNCSCTDGSGFGIIIK